MTQLDLFDETGGWDRHNALSIGDIYCPIDGGQLKHSEWEWCDFILLICPRGHVFEVQTQEYGGYKPGYYEFDLMEMATCQCGKTLPARLMEPVNYGEQPSAPPAKIPEKREYKPWPKPVKKRPSKVCPDCLERIQEAWLPDPKASHARLTIWPVDTEEGIVFVTKEEVRIEPYPNPYGSGGMYGSGVVKTEAEVDQLIDNLKHGYWEDWIEKKGVPVEIIRKPQMTVAEYRNDIKRDYLIAHPEEATKTENTQLVMV